MKDYRRLTAAHIKWIACLLMLTDHVGSVLFVQCRILRILGRAAFPLFIFLLVEGFFYTRSRMRYFLRLLVFAVLSEAPFDMALYLSSQQIRDGIFFYSGKANVMWTLLLGFLFMAYYELVDDFFAGVMARRRKVNQGGQASDIPHLLIALVLSAPVLLLAVYAAEKINTDYHGYGVAAIAACFLLKKWQFPLWLQPVAAAFVLQSNPSWHTEQYAAFAALPLFFYSGQKGRNLPKYFFYLFYPAHLLLLVCLKLIWTGRFL